MKIKIAEFTTKINTQTDVEHVVSRTYEVRSDSNEPIARVRFSPRLVTMELMGDSVTPMSTPSEVAIIKTLISDIDD